MHKEMNLLVQGYATDAATAWEWARAMCERGYDLQVDDVGRPYFAGQSVRIVVGPEKGQLAWWVRKDGVPVVTHPDPVTAAVWWDLEKSNVAPVETQKSAATEPTKPAKNTPGVFDPWAYGQPRQELSDDARLARAVARAAEGWPPVIK